MNSTDKPFLWCSFQRIQKFISQRIQNFISRLFCGTIMCWHQTFCYFDVVGSYLSSFFSFFFLIFPCRRGLSKHYQGKSQSFTSLSNVKCIEDLAKKGAPYSEKMKSCKSYGGFSNCNKSYTPRTCTRTISKKASRSSFSCLLSKKSSFTCIRPPLPAPRSL